MQKPDDSEPRSHPALNLIVKVIGVVVNRVSVKCVGG